MEVYFWADEEGTLPIVVKVMLEIDGGSDASGEKGLTALKPGGNGDICFKCLTYFPLAYSGIPRLMLRL